MCGPSLGPEVWVGCAGVREALPKPVYSKEELIAAIVSCLEGRGT